MRGVQTRCICGCGRRVAVKRGHRKAKHRICLKATLQAKVERRKLTNRRRYHAINDPNSGLIYADDLPAAEIERRIDLHYRYLQEMRRRQAA